MSLSGDGVAPMEMQCPSGEGPPWVSWWHGWKPLPPHVGQGRAVNEHLGPPWSLGSRPANTYPQLKPFLEFSKSHFVIQQSNIVPLLCRNSSLGRKARMDVALSVRNFEGRAFFYESKQSFLRGVPHRSNKGLRGSCNSPIRKC